MAGVLCAGEEAEEEEVEAGGAMGEERGGVAGERLAKRRRFRVKSNVTSEPDGNNDK